jgi:hypothetical protein
MKLVLALTLFAAPALAGGQHPDRYHFERPDRARADRPSQERARPDRPVKERGNTKDHSEDR